MKSAAINPLEEAMSIIGGRWRIILVHFLLNGPRRFTDLQREVGISRRMLTVNLRALEEAGLVSRTPYAEVPPRVEYGLTPEGMELRPLIDCLCSLGQKFGNRKNMNGIALPTSSPVE